MQGDPAPMEGSPSDPRWIAAGLRDSLSPCSFSVQSVQGLPGLFLPGVVRRPQAKSTSFLATFGEATGGSGEQLQTSLDSFTVNQRAAGQVLRQGRGGQRGRRKGHILLSPPVALQSFAAIRGLQANQGLPGQVHSSTALTLSYSPV